MCRLLRTLAALGLVLFSGCNNNPWSTEAAGTNTLESVYDVPIKTGVLYQPHPAFARVAQARYR